MILSIGGRQVLILKRGRWWIVIEPGSRDVLSGGFVSRAEAVAEARCLLGGPR